MTSPAVLAVDVGGTTIKAASVADDGRVLAEQVEPSRAGRGPEAVVSAIVEVGRAVLRRTPDTHGVHAAGVVVPGIVDGEIARLSINLGWRDLALAKRLRDAWTLPVALDNDVRAATRAECTTGAAAGASDAMVAVIGTGIAAGAMCAGAIVSGATGSAGELGHVPVHPGGDPCTCGQRGCLETYASARAIAQRYAAATGQERSAADVAAAVEAGEPAAVEVWAAATATLGLALATQVLVLDPGVIVLAGGLSEAGETLRAPVADALSEQLAWRPAPRVEISPYGAHLGRQGATLLARGLPR